MVLSWVAPRYTGWSEQNPYTQAVLASAPVGLWRFEETSGAVAVDSSGNGHNGAISLANPDVPGRVGSGMSFDGSSQAQVEVPHHSSLMPRTAVTMEALVWLESAPSGRAIMGKGDSNNGFRTHARASRVLVMVIADDATFTHVDSTLTVPLQEWTYVCITFDGAANQVRFFIHGQTEVISMPRSVIRQVTDVLRIGRYFDPGGVTHQPWHGIIDEPALYNRALPLSEIQEHFNALTTLVAPPSIPRNAQVRRWDLNRANAPSIRIDWNVSEYTGGLTTTYTIDYEFNNGGRTQIGTGLARLAAGTFHDSRGVGTHMYWIRADNANGSSAWVGPLEHVIAAPESPMVHTFSDATDGQAVPPGWEEMWTTPALSRVVAAPYYTDLRSLVRQGYSGWRGMGWTAFGPATDVDIQIRVRLSALGSTFDVSAVVRATGAPGAAQAVIATLWSANISAAILTNNARTARANAAFEYRVREWYNIRLRVVGIHVFTKAWKEGTAEPSAWMGQGTIPVSALDVPGPGLVGIAENADGYRINELDCISAVKNSLPSFTHNLPALPAPVDPHPPVPPNVTATPIAGGVRVAWSPVSNVTGYKIYRNKVLIATVTGASSSEYVDAQASTSTAQDYNVRSYRSVP